MIGLTVSHYHILEKLGEGGMGEVWRARDTRLDRFVALKFVPERTAGDASTVERFLREARAASALNHPNICTIFDVGEWEGRRYIVMELVEGATLRDRIAAGPLDVETVVDIGIQLADALDAAHARSIVHRDIKSTNIMLSPRGRTTILDFGLAKIVMEEKGAPHGDAPTVAGNRDLTDAGQAVGTVGTMSPEQALGRDVDGRSDIFSLGAVLYEIATGRQAFPGSTSAAVFDAILNRAPVAPIQINPNVPPELERILNKMLEKDRDLRYQSAAEVVTDLKRLRRDSGSQVSVSVPAAKPARRGGRALVILAGVAVVAAVAVFAGMKFRNPSPKPLGPVKTRPLTSTVGVEDEATWSPDGNFVAYAHCADGPMDIFVMSIAGGDPIHLVESPWDDGSPRWSPDNRWIAFLSGRGGSAGLYLVPPLGGSVRRLADLGGDGLHLSGGPGRMPWSPDGKRLTYTRGEDGGRSAVYTIDVETGVERRITSPPEGFRDADPSWSFDGKSIVFARAGSTTGGSLLIVDPEGGEPRTRFTDESVPQQPAWTPDSRGLVFVSERTGSDGLWYLPPGADTPLALTSGGTDVGSPAVSRNGDVLYNTSSHQTDLYTLDLETRTERRLTSHTKDNFSARYSPDGTKVVYSSTRTGDWEVWVLDPATGEETRPAPSPQFDGMACWSPDGRTIYFLSDRDGKPGLWSVNAGGGAPKKLFDGPVGVPVLCSPDGKEVAFPAPGSTGGVLKAIPVGGGSARDLLAGVEDFAWYLDSHRVIATVKTGETTSEMRAVNLDTGEFVTLLTDPQIELAVAADGRGVSYSSAQSHFNMNLHILPLVPPATPDGLPRPAGPPEKITHGDGEWHVHNGGWSPDAKHVIYTRDTDTGDIYLMEKVFPPGS